MPVEGYSNLAWILLIAIPGYFGADLIVATRVISSLLMLSVLALNFCYWRPFMTTLTEENRAGKNSTDKNWRYFLIAQYAFAFSATTGVWMVGGLEQPLLAALLAAALVSMTRALKHDDYWFWLLASLCLGIMCLTRPDIPLLCAAIALGIFISRGFTLKRFLQCTLLAVLPILFVLAQTLFRLHYYGEWVPNTAYIKAQPNLMTWLTGFVYISTGLLFMLPLSFYAFKAIGVARNSPHRDLAMIALSAISLTLIYLFIIGGDIFPAYRHFTVIVVLMVFILPAIALYFERRQTLSTKRLTTLAIIYIVVQWGNPATGFSRGDGWVHEGKPIGEMFKTGWGNKQPTIAVDAAGSLPYYTKYPAIDMLGLNDHHIARQKPDLTTNYIGHQFGDGNYVYARQPDMVNFCIPQGKEKPCWSGGKTLHQLPEFQRNYTPVAFKYASDKIAIQWINVNSPIIGIEKSPARWFVPAYLFRGNGITQTHLNATQDFTVTISDKTFLEITTTKAIEKIKFIPKQAGIQLQIDKTPKGYRLSLHSQLPTELSAIQIHFKS